MAYQQRVWNTGTLASGNHTVKIWWDPNNATGKYISVDAFDVVGTLGTTTTPPPAGVHVYYVATNGNDANARPPPAPGAPCPRV